MLTRFVAGVALSMSALGAAGCGSIAPWQGKVDVTPISRPALDKCGRGEITEIGGRELLRAPYLQSIDQHSAIVAWGARAGRRYFVELRDGDGKLVTRSEARYDDPTARPDPGKDIPTSANAAPGSDNLIAAGVTKAQKPKAGERGTPSKEEPVPPAQFETVRADLGGLEPGTMYCYQVMSETDLLTRPAPLQTAPAPGADTKVSLVVLGDSGSGSAAQAAIAKRLAGYPFELMLFLGDIAYTNGTADELHNRFFQAYREYLAYVPAFPAIGNHDMRTRSGRAYERSFILPGNERYYSFDWGDAHFVALDTNRINREQTLWLDQDLAKTEAKWVIIFGHHPPLTSGARGGNRAFQRFFVPVLQRHRVDLILTGHDHHYERIGPLTGGMHLIVSGGGGAPLKTTGYGPATQKVAHVHHFLALDITKDTLLMRAIDIDGQEIDRLELKK